MTGFQTRNTNGAVVLDSDDIPISVTASGLVNIPSQWQENPPDYNTPMGNISAMRSNNSGNNDPLLQNDPNRLLWVKMAEGKRIWMPTGFIDLGGVWYAHTTRMTPPTAESGFLDVFDGAGKRVWSAIQAAKVPRITGFLTIPPNYDLKNNIYQQAVPYSPYLLASIIPGAYSISEGVGGMEGLLFRYQNGYLQCCYAGSGNWVGARRANGIKIPYAIISVAP